MRPKKIQGELKEKVTQALQTKSRKEVCAEFGLTYEQIRNEFGSKWRHTAGETVVAEVVS
jgi:hypothetical protein